MPCPHCKITIIKRSENESAVSAAAYQSGEKLFSEYDQEQKYYPYKNEVTHKEIMLPPHVPPEYADRNTLWNSAEAQEKQWNSQLARRFVLAIPREIPSEQYADLKEKKAVLLEVLEQAKEPTLPELLFQYLELRSGERADWTSRISSKVFPRPLPDFVAGLPCLAFSCARATSQEDMLAYPFGDCRGNDSYGGQLLMAKNKTEIHVTTVFDGELDASTLNRLIKEIVVHETIDSDKTRHISIEIHFNLKPIPEVEQVTG